MDQQSFLALRNNNLLKNADINKLDIGSKIGKLKSVNSSEILYKSGDPSNSIYLVINGKISLIKKNSNGESQSVVFSGNDFFGAKELFSNIDRCSTTVSLTDTYLMELSKEEVEKLIDADDKISLNLQKGNTDFNFDKGNTNIIGKEYFEDINENDEIVDKFTSKNDINEIIKSIEKQEEEIFNAFSNFEKRKISFDYVNSQEMIDIEKKNNYNCISNKRYKNIENSMKDEPKITESNDMSTKQFNMIVKALQLVNANVKRDDVLNNIVDVAVNLTNADRGTLYLVDKGTKEIWSKVLIGEEIEEIRLKVGEGIAGWVAENGEILNIRDVNEDERFDRSFDKVTGYITKNMLVFPIKDKTEQTVGVLQLLNSLKGGFSEQEEMFLGAISLNIALALENASLVEQLLHSERSASIGKMGNFLTHDIKRPVLICKRYAEHLQKKELNFDVKQIVNLLAEQLDQVASQLESASGFTEGTTLLRRQPVGINDTLHEFAINIHTLIKSNNCKIEHELGDDVLINVDKKEFYQCYYNVIKNACEALQDGGNVFISTEKKDDNIVVNINDKGIGIKNSDLKFIFDPLWTKNKKNNSGLGLSISKKIVEDHNGTITLKSDPELGTTVSISLPIH